MAFSYQQNIDVANFGEALLDVKTRLKAAGWTVQDSGDGRDGSTPQVYGNGADVITTAANVGVAASYVAGDITNRYAWFRLRSPAGLGGCEIIIQHGIFNASSDLYGMWLVPESVSNALWSGAAADDFGEPPADTVLIPIDAANTNGNTPIVQDVTVREAMGYGTTAAKLDMAIGDASEGYAFYAFCRTAASRVFRGFLLDAVAELHPDDAHPYVLMRTGTTDLFAASSTLDDARTVWGIHRGYESSSAKAAVTDEGDPVVEETERHRRGGLSVCLLRPMLFNQSGNDFGNIGLNPYNGLAEVCPMAWWYRPSFPSNFDTRGSPRYPGFKGKSRLLALGGGGVTTMAVANGQNLVAQSSGRVWVRWDSAVAPLDPGGGAITAAVDVNAHTHLDVAYNDLTAQAGDDLPTDLIVPEGAFDPVMVNILGSPATVKNRVWDAIAGRHVTWESSQPDVGGTGYPGPGTFGVDTSDYCIDVD